MVNNKLSWFVSQKWAIAVLFIRNVRFLLLRTETITIVLITEININIKWKSKKNRYVKFNLMLKLKY